MQANRKDLVEEHSKQKTTARDLVRLEKQRRLAETLREKADAEDAGEDLERKKNWEYSLEENDDWEKRKARKERRSNFQFNGMCVHANPLYEY
jgi:pre-mRNA-splicing factor SYF2